MLRYFTKTLFVSYVHETGVGWCFFKGKSAKKKMNVEDLESLQEAIKSKENCTACIITNWKRIW